MTRLAFISDTHCYQGRLTPSIVEARADVLVHSGDFTGSDTSRKTKEIADFADWCSMLLRKQYVKHIVLVAGNHDEWLDQNCPEARRRDDPQLAESSRSQLMSAGVTYLQDSGATIEGLTFWGSPWTTRHGDWGFQIDSDEQDESIFSRVPNVLDVLVTHSPPYGIRDEVIRGEHGELRARAGSYALKNAVYGKLPKIHAFGHIHHWRGITVMPWGGLCINACSISDRVNPPFVFDVMR